MKRINELIDTDYDFEVTGITDDSRLVKKGYIFVTTHGFNVDHFDYIESAINSGCSFVVSDKELNVNFPHIIVDNINDYYKGLCKKFYDIDFKNYRFIGITGTDGKTTTATIVSRLIDNCAYIGTNGLQIGDDNFSTNNTTPCISELYQSLQKIHENRLTDAVMEISSEALLHERVSEFEFDIVAFTNITGDHLNVHKTFDNYLKAKLKLLDLLKKDGIVVVNGDDVNLKCIKHNNLYSFGEHNDNDFIIKNYKEISNFTNIEVVYGDKLFKIESPLKGKYNVYNVVMAFIIGYLYGIKSETLLKKIKELKPINGRGEFLNFGQDYDIVLDYAHTINGISSILEAFKNYKRIITVTGCAGGREATKRRVIGKLIMKKSDVAVFTMDDPRYESVDKIIDEMVGEDKDYIRIIDREEAINYALSIADKDSVVLILGKGRDNYMAIEDKKVPYNDYDVIKKYFKNL